MWHASDAAVYWTDINRFLVHRFTPADQCVRTWFFDEPVTALTLTDRDDTLAVILGSQVILWDPRSDRRSRSVYRLERWPEVRFNDARADPRGSLWIGSMRNNVNADGSPGKAGGREGVLCRLQPDGSCVDAEGYLWNCRFFGGCIVRVAPDGQIDRVVEMPVQNITTCTFGGTDRKTLYVTTAAIEAPPADRLAGGLFAIRTEVQGQPENRFAIFGIGRP